MALRLRTAEARWHQGDSALYARYSTLRAQRTGWVDSISHFFDPLWFPSWDPRTNRVTS